MTRRRFPYSGLLVVFLFVNTALLAGPATSPSGPSNVTVGDFTKMVASQVNPNDVTRRGGRWQALTPEEAGEILQRLHIEVKSKPSSPLTERDAAELFRQFGITLQAPYPDSPLGLDRAEALIGIFGTTLSSSAGKI